jgi:hypothetical protein
MKIGVAGGHVVPRGRRAAGGERAKDETTTSERIAIGA